MLVKSPLQVTMGIKQMTSPGGILPGMRTEYPDELTTLATYFDNGILPTNRYDKGVVRGVIGDTVCMAPIPCVRESSRNPITA